MFLGANMKAKQQQSCNPETFINFAGKDLVSLVIQEVLAKDPK
jgi:hypothetical protein